MCQKVGILDLRRALKVFFEAQLKYLFFWQVVVLSFEQPHEACATLKYRQFVFRFIQT